MVSPAGSEKNIQYIFAKLNEVTWNTDLSTITGVQAINK